MFLRRPLLGWGLGSFPIVYPQFRSFYTTFFVNQAHNDYLQLLVETGLAGFAIAAWYLMLVFRKAAGKLKNWTETATGALTAASLLGCVGILVHSFLDFNLQIPANAALFYVLSAVAASVPLQESTRRRVVRRHNLIVQPPLDNPPQPVE
jgi:O-antigen ligase